MGSGMDPNVLDRRTVELLQLKMSVYSTHDAETIRNWMRDRKLFCNVHDSSRRLKIQERVLQCERIVTLQSFIQDSRLLKSCADGFYQLLPATGRGKQSLRQNLQNHWTSNGKEFKEIYLDLCCQSNRDFKYLSEGKYSQPLKDRGQRKPTVQPCDHQRLGSLAFLAQSSGIKTNEIDQLIARAPGPLAWNPHPWRFQSSVASTSPCQTAHAQTVPATTSIIRSACIFSRMSSLEYPKTCPRPIRLHLQSEESSLESFGSIAFLINQKYQV